MLLIAMTINLNTVMTMITVMVTAILIKIREKHQESLPTPRCQSPPCLATQKDRLTSMKSV